MPRLQQQAYGVQAARMAGAVMASQRANGHGAGSVRMGQRRRAEKTERRRAASGTQTPPGQWQGTSAPAWLEQPSTGREAAENQLPTQSASCQTRPENTNSYPGACQAAHPWPLTDSFARASQAAQPGCKLGCSRALQPSTACAGPECAGSNEQGKQATPRLQHGMA